MHTHSLMRQGLFCLALFSLAFTGCTTRFAANFEADTVGAEPDVYPAGNPSGDSMYPIPYLSPGSVMVTDNNPLSGGKSLLIQRPVDTNPPGVMMYAESIANTNQRVYASWAGSVSADTEVEIKFFAGHFREIVQVVLKKGRIFVNGQNTGPCAPDTKHLIFVNANPATDTFELSLLAQGRTNVRASGPILNPDKFPSENIGLWMQISDGNVSSSYRVDDVRMSEKKP